MKKIYTPILIIGLATCLFQCEVAEKTESKSEEAKSEIETDTVEQPNVLSDGISIVEIPQKDNHPEAGFEMTSPKNMQQLPIGEVKFEFNTKKFPFVDGHSVRLAIENGTDRFVFDANKKIFLPKGVFLCAAYLFDGGGISLKNSHSTQLTQLNVGVDEKREIDTKQPMVFLNLPDYREGTNVIVDFMLFNIDLSPKGNKVRLSIDEGNEMYVDSWKVLNVKGLKPGKHKILLELINENGKNYDGVYSHDEREFEVK